MPELDSSDLSAQREKALKTGTTTVGITCSDGVILASDRRASMGYFIASKDIQKVFQIDDRLAMTVAGSVADAQSIIRMMQAECKLYQLKHGKKISAKAATTILSNIMFAYKYFPFYVQLLLGGVEDKPEIYGLDPLGGVTEEKFIVSTGSGSPFAYGLLEEMAVKDGTIKENLPIALKAVKTAMKRDCASGEYVDIITVTKAGFRRLEKDEVAKLEK